MQEKSRSYSRALTALVLCWLSLSSLASVNAQPDQPAVSFEREQGQIRVLIGGHPFATYFYADSAITRPYWAHVHAPCGVQVTRNHPPHASDLQDHAALHPGIWLAFGDISGNDYWRLKAKVVHDRIVQAPSTGAGQGEFAVLNRYLTRDERATICTELCRLSIRVRPSGYLILWDSCFQAGEQEFYFGDQEEMGLGVRLATALREDGGSGRILSSENRRGAQNTWGREADWCDYAGHLGGRWVGITIMAAPHHKRPTWWHNRGYGFFAANQFGRRAMRQGRSSKLAVPPGEQLRLQYGVLIHSTPTEQDIDLATVYADYCQLIASGAETPGSKR